MTEQMKRALACYQGPVTVCPTVRAQGALRWHACHGSPIGRTRR